VTYVYDLGQGAFVSMFWVQSRVNVFMNFGGWSTYVFLVLGMEFLCNFFRMEYLCDFGPKSLYVD
jgi:uncharacterized membrane protein